MVDGHRRMEVSEVEELPGNRQAATLTYTIGDRTWSQRILTQNLTEEQLSTQLTDAGLRLTGYLSPDKTWVRAQPA
jgi:hypothetical protein